MFLIVAKVGDEDIDEISSMNDLVSVCRILVIKLFQEFIDEVIFDHLVIAKHINKGLNIDTVRQVVKEEILGSLDIICEWFKGEVNWAQEEVLWIDVTIIVLIHVFNDLLSFQDRNLLSKNFIETHLNFLRSEFSISICVHNLVDFLKNDSLIIIKKLWSNNG